MRDQITISTLNISNKSRQLSKARIAHDLKRHFFIISHKTITFRVTHLVANLGWVDFESTQPRFATRCVTLYVISVNFKM